MSEDRKRGNDGRYVETVSPEDVVEVLYRAADPVMSAKEIGDQLGRSSESARQKLSQLAEQGRVERKKVGAGAVVWWLSSAERTGSDPADVDPTDPFFSAQTFASGESGTSDDIDGVLYDDPHE